MFRPRARGFICGDRLISTKRMLECVQSQEGTMFKKSCYLGIAFCALMVCGPLFAQEQAPHIGNGDIINMLRAHVPESTIVSQLEILATRGADFDISPAAIIELQRNGASEKVMNTMVWVETNIVPGIA